jgi:N-acetylmuramoyl-L-alanine amidase
MPGDKIVIRDKKLKEVSKPDGKVYKFLRKGVPALFRLQLFDGEKPRANQKYTLVVDGRKLSGQTDANGVLEQHIPTDAVEGEVIIGPDNLRLELSFGQLNPADEIIGIQQRLRNLGFDCGEPSGEMDAATVEALLAFQRRFGLKATGKADEATLEKLRKLHDSDEKFPDDIKTA